MIKKCLACTSLAAALTLVACVNSADRDAKVGDAGATTLVQGSLVTIIGGVLDEEKNMNTKIVVASEEDAATPDDATTKVEDGYTLLAKDLKKPEAIASKLNTSATANFINLGCDLQQADLQTVVEKMNEKRLSEEDLKKDNLEISASVIAICGSQEVMTNKNVSIKAAKIFLNNAGLSMFGKVENTLMIQTDSLFLRGDNMIMLAGANAHGPRMTLAVTNDLQESDSNLKIRNIKKSQEELDDFSEDVKIRIQEKAEKEAKEKAEKDTKAADKSTTGSESGSEVIVTPEVEKPTDKSSGTEVAPAEASAKLKLHIRSEGAPDDAQVVKK